MKLKQAVREAATICPVPCKLTFDHLTLKVVSKSGVPLCHFSLPRPLCSRLRPDVRDRQTSDAHHCLMPSAFALWGQEQYGTRIMCIAGNGTEKFFWGRRWA